MAVLGLIVGFVLGVATTIAVACCFASSDSGDDL